MSGKNMITSSAEVKGAFFGDKLLKAGRLSAVKKKITDGRLKHGTYGEEDDQGRMVGCAVFVTTCESSNPHQKYPNELGWHYRQYHEEKLQ